MKTIVTGGAGFIGSHLVDLLIADGHEVIVIDNLATGNVENLRQHKDSGLLQFVKHDIADYDGIKDVFTGVDWVFHLAALADIVPSIEKPLDYHHSNVDGTISVLQASHRAGVKRFIYAASSSCYGIPDNYPTSENDEIRPQYPYALTKNIGEQYVMHWEKIYHLPAISLRMFNVYGPRSRTSGTYGAVFGVFLAQKLAEKPLTIVGDGTQTRDFTYVGDVVRAYLAAAKSDLSGEIMNIGSGNTYSVNRLCELLGGETVNIPKRPGEPDCTFADTRKVTELLDWHPQTSFEDGVGIMLKNIDYWKKAPVWDSQSIEEATKDWFKYLGDDRK